VAVERLGGQGGLEHGSGVIEELPGGLLGDRVQRLTWRGRTAAEQAGGAEGGGEQHQRQSERDPLRHDGDSPAVRKLGSIARTIP